MPTTALRRLVVAFVLGLSSLTAAAADVPSCGRVVRADVVALDEGYYINRLGASRPGGMMFALRGDVDITAASPNAPASVQLKAYKRPRPIVLRVNVGDCLDINFQNLLTRSASDLIQPVTRNASIHVAGMQVRNGMDGNGIWAGNGGDGGVVAPGGMTTYRLYADAEGTFLLYSSPGDYNNFGTQQLTMGLFGAVNVEPKNSEWYRSQVTEADLKFATMGMMPDGHPRINYDAVYPPGNARAGKPVLRMLDGENRIMHSDLTAVITGKNRGMLDVPAGNSEIMPHRDWPFREVTVHYHESQDVVPAFPYFDTPANGNVPTVNAGQDSFAINYGVAGIGPEVLANRIGVGPTKECVECKFEEFFLSSWALGDPGLIVDKPANLPCTMAQLEQYAVNFRAPNSIGPANPCDPDGKARATMAAYPDDPSNVYHSYLGDHVRFRILHAGAAVHHVHHHHAHQWLFAAANDNSSYLDSQSIGPGAGYSLELVYEGAGNRNLTPGDSIFHCHFYPHFASGMWALFRVHDAFEGGTAVDHKTGVVIAGSRALPDKEIAAGTPIPAVIPLPTYAMAPMPSEVSIVDGKVQTADGFPGYPFYIPGEPGHRAPHPPLDFAVDPKTNERYDGGLPRHLVTGGHIANEQHTTTDWSKDADVLYARELPENGTPGELRAIQFFSLQKHPSYRPDGTPAPFRVNGLPRGAQHGAPFADPAVIDGKAIGNQQLIYKGVDLQLDTVFNKAGWHYPQQRMMALWGDVQDLVSGKKPPEPLFFRATSNDVVEFWHTNLVPAYFELDDFEVRTPTDILGQHIHLVKFDVTSSDGAANGFNYEDGTFSPEEVRGRISEINAGGGLLQPDGTKKQLAPKAIGELGAGPRNSWVGAQATVQRWWVDPLMKDAQSEDRTYMTVFTHDHFGPSTHQMIGLYGGLLVEPQGTKWTSLDGRTQFGSRDDGGPTSYAANVLYSDPMKSRDNYREFALEWGDLQLVYAPNSKATPDCYPGQTPANFDCKPLAPGGTYMGWSDPAHVINCGRCSPLGAGGTGVTTQWGVSPSPPTPFLIADFGAGVMSMNYRGEPLPLRVFKPATPNPGADANAGDLSHAFRSIARYDKAFSTQPAAGSQIDSTCTGADCFKFPLAAMSPGMEDNDPFTPMMHAYEGDKVQVRLLTGAHTSMHDFTMHGVNWLAQPFDANSGYKQAQFTVLSEHFEMLFRAPRVGAPVSSDYLYNTTASYEGLTNGAWGLLRAWNPATPQTFLAPLTSTAAAAAPPAIPTAAQSMSTNCANVHPCRRNFEVHAMTAQKAMNTATGLIYNSRGINLTGGKFDSAHPIVDPNALVYVLYRDAKPVVSASGPEPLVLRVNAGDMIHVTLVNDFAGTEPVFTTAESAQRWGQIPYAFPYDFVNITTSSAIGLHAQLVELDVNKGSGVNVGRNPVQTATPGQSIEYDWYAGIDDNGKRTPVEFGAVSLMPADPLMQVYRGLFGALVVEPEDARWIADPHTQTAATVWSNGKSYREFVLAVQDDVNMMLNGSSTYAAGTLSAVNYKTDPMFYRLGKNMAAAMGSQSPADWTNLGASDLQNLLNINATTIDTTRSTANLLTGGDPQTPILRAPAGMPVRIHLVCPGGIGDNQQNFELAGHAWQFQPYTNASTKIGFNPLSEWTGTQSGYGPATAYTVVLDDAPGGLGGAAGGRFHVPGDYLYRSWTANQFEAGVWGLFRVQPNTKGGNADTIGVLSATQNGDSYQIRGFATAAPASQTTASSVSVKLPSGVTSANVVDGMWMVVQKGTLPAYFTVTSPNGGSDSYGIAPKLTLTAMVPVATQPSMLAPVRKDKSPRQPR
jgi:hypothetical protein